MQTLKEIIEISSQEFKHGFKIHDEVITKPGAGGLVHGGLRACVLVVNGNALFIRVKGNNYHVQANEIISIN